MKKIISVILLVLLCLLASACNGGEPEAPNSGKLEEKVYFDYGSDGFSVTKYLVDKNGKIMEEHLYGIDEKLGILTQTALAKNAYDGNGKLTSSVCRYMSHALNATPETVMTLSASDNKLYQYRVTNQSGNTLTYINEETDAGGKTVREDYYTPGGRLILTQTYKYRENGEKLSTSTFNAEGTEICSCSYNEKGNFTSAKIHDGENTTEITAEYYENGVIKSYTNKKTDKLGGYVYSPFTVTFNEQGNVTKYNDISAFYDASGTVLKSIQTSLFEYKADENGRITEKITRTNITNPVKTTYSYNEYGRLTGEKSNNNNQLVSSKTYKWNDDGTYTEEIRGKNSVLSKITEFNKSGLPTRTDNYSNGKAISYFTYEYDALGRLLETAYFENNKSKGTISYKYNLHGDVTKEKKTGSFGSVNNGYEYYDDGKLKLQIVYNMQGGKVSSTEFLEDGGYCYTTYTSYTSYNSVTYNDKNVMVKQESVQEGKKIAVFYEYHENGKASSITTYQNDELISLAKYNKNGNVEELTIREENGKLTLSKYTRTDKDMPTRIDIYTDGEFDSYVLLEYFVYSNDSNNQPKSIRTYNKNDELVLNVEYEKIYVKNLYKYIFVLVREEAFDGGVLIASAYMEYSEEDGSIIGSREIAGNRYVETTYKNNGIFEQKIYVDDVLVSVYFLIKENSTTTYAEEFYNDKGQVIRKCVYRSYSTEKELSKTYEYEYYDTGELLKESLYGNYSGQNKLQCVKEYSKEGKLIKEESFLTYNTGDPYKKEVSYYDDNGLVIRMLELGYPFDESNIEGETLYEYNENGNLIKKLATSYTNGKISNTILREFDDQGRDIHLRFEFDNGNVSETFKKYGPQNDMIDYEHYENGVLTEKMLKEYDENGNLIRELDINKTRKKETLKTYTAENLLKEIAEYENDELTGKIVYEYHANGKRSSVTKYDAEGKIVSQTFYDEDGRWIPNS